MFPTSTLPLAPSLGVAGMGTLLGLVALGAVVALIVGLVLHRRDPQGSPAVDLSGADADSAPAAKSTGTRLSA